MMQVEEKNYNDNYSKKDLQKYYTGSMVRHTLIQVSGYLSFLQLLINEDLLVKAKSVNNLIAKNKSGFNPFYIEKRS